MNTIEETITDACQELGELGLDPTSIGLDPVELSPVELVRLPYDRLILRSCFRPAIAFVALYRGNQSPRIHLLEGIPDAAAAELIAHELTHVRQTVRGHLGFAPDDWLSNLLSTSEMEAQYVEMLAHRLMRPRPGPMAFIGGRLDCLRIARESIRMEPPPLPPPDYIRIISTLWRIGRQHGWTADAEPVVAATRRALFRMGYSDTSRRIEPSLQDHLAGQTT